MDRPYFATSDNRDLDHPNRGLKITEKQIY